MNDEERTFTSFTIDVIDNSKKEHSRKIIRFNKKLKGFSLNELKQKLFPDNICLERIRPYHVGHTLILLDNHHCYDLDHLDINNKVKIIPIGIIKDKSWNITYADYIKYILAYNIGTRLAEENYVKFFNDIILNKYKRFWVRLQQEINNINRLEDNEIKVDINYNDIVIFTESISDEIKITGSNDQFKSDYEQVIDLMQQDIHNNRYHILINNIKIPIGGIDYHNTDKNTLNTVYILNQVEQILRRNVMLVLKEEI